MNSPKNIVYDTCEISIVVTYKVIIEAVYDERKKKRQNNKDPWLDLDKQRITEDGEISLQIWGAS